jgi:broad specificity phosphatase PhoE
MRHGEPEIPALPEKVNAHEFLECLKLYNTCGIVGSSRPNQDAINQFKDFPAIVSSDLKRSVESASLFSPFGSLIIDPQFREIEDSFIPIPLIKLAPKTWGDMFILLWLAGMFEFKQAFKEGRVRARDCANKLVRLAHEHGKVLFVGHGFINTYIAKELKLLGWNGPKLPSKTYWDYGLYQKQAY